MFNRFAYPVSAGLIFIVCLTAAGNVSGHAVVTESSLRGQALEAQKATRVVLNFNSGVELSLSKFDLVRKGDAHETVAANHGSKPGQIILAIPALSPGDYAIHYKVFAADGHLTEDIIRFGVAGNTGR
ncbi:MAG: copper resistance CopC family protein [Methylococcales bacterium]